MQIGAVEKTSRKVEKDRHDLDAAQETRLFFVRWAAAHSGAEKVSGTVYGIVKAISEVRGQETRRLLRPTNAAHSDVAAVGAMRAVKLVRGESVEGR